MAFQAPTSPHAAIEEHGFTVKSTFIDGPAQWFDAHGAARRTSSAPPRSHPAFEEQKPRLLLPACPRAKEPEPESLKVRERSPSADSAVSTTASSASPAWGEEDEDVFASPSDSSRSSQVEDVSDCNSNRRPRVRSPATLLKELRDCGLDLLPSAKRSKWQQPLCWAAREVLRRQGVEAEVQGGELRVRQSEEAFIRVDFAPGRLPVADSEERPFEQLLAA